MTEIRSVRLSLRCASPSVIRSGLALSSTGIGQGHLRKSGKVPGKVHDGRDSMEPFDEDAETPIVEESFSGLRAGHRVHHRRWNQDGTIVRVWADNQLGVRFDGGFAEHEVSESDVDQIPGCGDPTSPFLIADGQLTLKGDEQK